MRLFTSSTYLFYLPKMIMMMNHLFLQSSNPGASTVVTRYASAFETMRDEIGPVDPTEHIVIYIYDVIHREHEGEEEG